MIEDFDADRDGSFSAAEVAAIKKTTELRTVTLTLSDPAPRR